MAKLVTTDLTSLQNETTAISQINTNFNAVDTAMENTLSRDGTSPNTMGANLDMNTNRILNLPLPSGDTEPVRKGEFDDLNDDIDAALGAAVATAVAAAEAAQAAAEVAEANAQTAETNAETAETNAEAAAAAAAASADAFDDVYLGTKAANPTLDNDGNALVEGQLYFNSVSDELRVYNGSAWLAYSPQPGITELVEDTSPQLGGALDLNGFDVSGVAQKLTIGTIELGHASQTTLSGAAGVLSVEGSAVLTAATGQPLDSDLTAIAALTTTTFGRSILTAASIVRTLWIPATAMTPRTTNGAAPGVTEMATNKNMIRSLDFDTSTVEYAQFEIAMPVSWNEGTITFQAVWSHASTVTNFGVVFALEAVARSDDDVQDVAFGSNQNVTDTGGTTNDLYISPTSSALTIGGTPAAGDSVLFQVRRVTGDAGDTLGIDARLQGIRIFYTCDAHTD